VARSNKGARRIVVDEVTFRWRAAEKDGGISLTVWPADLPGPTIVCSWTADDLATPCGPVAAIITNRIVRRVIELAVASRYDAHHEGPTLTLDRVGEPIDLVLDAVRRRDAR
jgi:hypothetical protein